MNNDQQKFDKKIRFPVSGFFTLFYSYLIFSLHSPFKKAQDYASSVEVELASTLIYGNEANNKLSSMMWVWDNYENIIV
ncbi:hypothetical protein [Vibrio cholerae]|uniref:hypothetical protein n=1 Tax=Vibrio cholerae TaxID=666 RepID=UPI0011D9DC30|nr:hypothetical protein [Vibrio cholerae]TXY49256.1 hypothetical protein FXE77_12955 [Vibrio cholerae]